VTFLQSLSESTEDVHRFLVEFNAKARFWPRLLMGLDCLSCLELPVVDETPESGELYSSFLLCKALED
jgi:hypothetical protein